ncbi:L-histidine N(alpha)-methyltransferase [Hymenobacter oligotrophus]|uniref:L-histidine N(Alpha)-methyltransferase n=1 Tax=Hymenobacter oligotrophus TaxID=2319843 RepID=A0A3B7RNU2_9BACT|nr:L-histidine N(alpha)-methyltransferase [Hymenobacter oligotrophus]AYA35907.1 L-histidine N(alpha)-methyltransferase [Hymenobacter oligotrophus]
MPITHTAPSGQASPTTAAPGPAPTADFALAQHVLEGLSRPQRALSSMYFYDEAGSRLFQQIMELPEYYPTRTEFQLLTQHREAICAALAPENQAAFHLLELGAGDGLKTKILLRQLLEAQANVVYAPVDISASALEGLASSLRHEMPALQVQPLVAEYAAALAQMRAQAGRKAVLFLGSNIGNFQPEARQQFLRALSSQLTPNDRLLIGFDLQKNPRQIRAAYDDAQGVTAAFNLNLLTRLNRELGADFDLGQWEHFTDYDPQAGVIRSYLVSRQAQQVRIGALGRSFGFAAWETIHTENSYKFTLPQIEALGAAAGLAVQQVFADEQHWFADVLFAPQD